MKNLMFSNPAINGNIPHFGGNMGTLKDLSGMKFGRLTVIRRNVENIRNKPAWICNCDCGTETIKSYWDLKSGDSKSCGCLKKDLLRIELKEKKFGKLIVIDKAEKKGKSTAQFWKCKCDCGNEHIASSQHLRLGFIKSCGCDNKIDCQSYREQFESHVEKTESCWNWKGRTSRGYGIFLANKLIKAHRFSYFLHNGKIPLGKIICHHCDNPLCVNPKHLYAGTYKDNAQDRKQRGRSRKPKLLQER